DLCVIEADPPMAQPLGRAELFHARVDGRISAARPDHPLLGGAAGWDSAAGAGSGARRVVDQGSLLAVHRHDLRAELGSERHGTGQPWPGAPPRTATYARQLPAAGD